MEVDVGTENDLRMKFHATGWSFLLIVLENVLITVVTLGIYRFWAKTNYQKYVARNLEFDGERFSFHATGKERFLAFLKAIGIILLVYGLYQVLDWILQKALGDSKFPWATVLTVLTFFLLFPFIMVGRKRYLASRTAYRNLRFRFTGKGWELLKIHAKSILLTLVTFFFYIPFYYAKVKKYMTDNTAYGNTYLSYDGKGDEILLIYLKGYFLSSLTFGIYGAWWYAERANYDWDHTSIQGKRIGSDLKGSTVFWNATLSFLIVILTLGFGFPWAYIRMSKIKFQAIHLKEPLDYFSIQAHSDTGGSALAESLENIGDMLEGFFT